MALRALKTDEEIAGIPLDQEILIELPSGMPELEEKETKQPEAADLDAKKLQDQLEALQAAQRADRERADRLEREKADADRRAVQAAKEAEEARKRSQSLESDIITGGLQAAQTDRDAAKAAFRTAFEAGDANAMADAQSRIGRAEAKILAYESGAAEVAERKEAPRQVVEQPRQPTFEDSVRSNPNLMSSEREWMIKNEGSFKDPDFRLKVDSAYMGAMQKGLVRGSPQYFEHIERATGLKAAPAAEEEGNMSVQAPVSRSEHGADGSKPLGNRVTLSAEEREICKNMGVSEIDYARQKVAMAAAMKADPERYSNRG